MSALTRSIAQRPCALAFYLRGRINLYYNRFIFHRTDKGVADLNRALSMTTAESPPALVLRIYTSLGDGYCRLGNLTLAREAWSTGAARFPEDGALRRRLEKQGQELEWTVGEALAAERRVDTSSPACCRCLDPGRRLLGACRKRGERFPGSGDPLRRHRTLLRREESAKVRAASFLGFEAREHLMIDAGPRAARRAEVKRRVQRHRHVHGTPSIELEEAAMVVVVVVAQEEETLVEVADALEVGLEHHHGPRGTV